MLELLDLRDRGERLEPTALEVDPTVAGTVRDILARVRAEGDAVLLELAERFDGVHLGSLVVSDEELAAAELDTPAELKNALDALIARLQDLHARQLPREWTDERDGVVFGEIVRPLRSVGCYVPGGRGVYPSSVCMTLVPAVVAGVETRVLCTPSQSDGSVPPAVLYAAAKAGATLVIKSGGAQAIAALTYGTGSVPRVDRIVGPGNAYVTEAKRQVSGLVGIDGLAGPSELTVVAGPDADPLHCAVDLVAQAEHDPDSITHLVTTDPSLVTRVDQAITAELATAGRREIVEAALTHARAIVVRDEEQAAVVVDDLAAEHLLLLLPDPRGFLDRIRNAGAIFLGPWTAVPFGDYGVASNHVLPTAATARFASGLRAADYVTVRSVVEMTAGAAARLAPETSTIARSEGFDGHARAMDVRA
ncbi:MAG: histidinol dehydrogenase, partial [Actinobacteria bacterium]|nr:histidinol dehydrogenase [Actinomycetota bacterium]